jgi:hypothetical protein
MNMHRFLLWFAVLVHALWTPLPGAAGSAESASVSVAFNNAPFDGAASAQPAGFGADQSPLRADTEWREAHVPVGALVCLAFTPDSPPDPRSLPPWLALLPNARVCGVPFDNNLGVFHLSFPRNRSDHAAPGMPEDAAQTTTVTFRVTVVHRSALHCSLLSVAATISNAPTKALDPARAHIALAQMAASLLPASTQPALGLELAPLDSATGAGAQVLFGILFTMLSASALSICPIYSQAHTHVIHNPFLTRHQRVGDMCAMMQTATRGYEGWRAR